jgi:hypothetical protein
MKQINLFFILFWIKRNWQVIVITLLLLIVLFQCQPQPTLTANYKDNATKFQQKARTEVVQSNDIIKNYKILIKKKDAEILKLKKDSIKNSKSVNAKLSDLRRYKNTDIAKYYIDRYNQPQAIKSTSTNEVTIKDTLSRFIISDLIKYDGIKYDYKILTKEYSIVNSKFELANNTIDTLKVNINNISSAYESSINENKLAIKEVEKQLRKEKRNKTLYKITTVAAIIGGGYLLVK